MPHARTQWTLGAKLAMAGVPFLLIGLVTTLLTMAVSWRLDGGAAAVNEAGRTRMQAYRLAWSSAGAPDMAARAALVEQFERSLELLAQGDPERPLMVPWDSEVRERFAAVQAGWHMLRLLHQGGASVPSRSEIDRSTIELVARIDRMVWAIEFRLSRLTSLLHLLQICLLIMGAIASGVLVFTGYRFVLEPVAGLKRAVAQLQDGNLGVRIEAQSSDELGMLAHGFNSMAEGLEASYRDLESRVRDKTAELQDKRERLEALYEVSTLIASASSLQDMATGFTRRVRAVSRAEAAALRWASSEDDHFILLASEGLPPELMTSERCLRVGDCLCGATARVAQVRALPIAAPQRATPPACQLAGWGTVVVVPVLAQERLLGELDLFFRNPYTLSESERSLLEAITAHLASGMENLRLNGLEKEAAVAEERGFIARELHDSIAQSLAFLNIQTHLMREAMASGDRERMASVLAEIELGLRESHGDVRELLIHFRTRTNAGDIEPALRTTLRKFEHQSGIPAALALHNHGLPLAADVQVQVLHIVQEALSNVRKHAGADHVWLDVWQQPAWRLEVRDDGDGFDTGTADQRETSVGLGIMRERAERIGASLEVRSMPGRGTTVILALAAHAHAPVVQALQATAGNPT